MDQEVDWTKPVEILSSTEWIKYMTILEMHVVKNFQLKITRHFGIPVDYPCMVYSILDHNNRNIEHKFIYVQQAYSLVKAARQMESRFIRSITEF